MNRGRHPSEKTAFTVHLQIQHKGATPIEKNIIVIDEAGNEYEATYPKRAKGLVKNGRARFVDEHTICLACPPDTMKTEDITMSEHTINAQTAEATEAMQPTETTAAPQYTVEYILSRIAEIQQQTDYLHFTIAQLTAMGDGDSGDCGSPGNIQGQAKAQALGDIVRCRETTNQKMLAIYEKLLDRLTRNERVEIEKWCAIGAMTGLAEITGTESDDQMTSRENILDAFRQILRENQ